jgi:hypothetical protein
MVALIEGQTVVCDLTQERTHGRRLLLPRPPGRCRGAFRDRVRLDTSPASGALSPVVDIQPGSDIMGDFKGWEQISDNEYVADLGHVGRIAVSKSDLTGRWTATAFSWSQSEFATAVEAQAAAAQIACRNLDQVAARGTPGDLQIAVERLDELNPSARLTPQGDGRGVGAAALRRDSAAPCKSVTGGKSSLTLGQGL